MLNSRLLDLRGQIPPPNAPASFPANPPWSPRRSDETQEQSNAHHAYTRAAARNPATLRVQSVPGRCTSQLSTEDANHVRGVDSIAGFRLDGVDGGAVGDLRGLETQVDGEGLDDGTRDSEWARVRSDDGADQTIKEAEHDAEYGDEAVDDCAGIERSQADRADADKGEKADDEGVVVIGRGREEEREGCPVAGEYGGGQEADETGLHEHGVLEEHLKDAEEDLEVVDAGGIGRGVVGHEEEEEGKDKVLHGEGKPIDTTPRGVLREDAGEEAGEEHAEKHA